MNQDYYSEENPNRRFETPDDAQEFARRWIAELNSADEAEQKFRQKGKEIMKTYGEVASQRRHSESFNILYSNTETMATATYNSSASPDIRRRFRERDPVAKSISTILQRVIEYENDMYQFDYDMKGVVRDALLPGRGVARVRYEPEFETIVEMELQPAQDENGEEILEDVTDEFGNLLRQEPKLEEVEVEYEVLVAEHTPTELVQYDDFRQGPGKRWGEVPWIAFRHWMYKKEAKDMFGAEVSRQLPWQSTIRDDEDANESQTSDMFKQTEVWEIWDKENKEVIYISKNYSDGPLREPDEDPLQLRNFFPIPRPLLTIQRTDSLEPIALYTQYESLAKQLNKVTRRIERITDAIKARGAYLGTVKEIEDILSAADNKMIPIKSITNISDIGGLDKAIWMLPVDQLAKTLDYLNNQREHVKQSIYEITGISDIVRGSTKASETATAQQIKSQWGSLRLQELQREAQRFARDLIEIKAEIIAEQYSPETMQQISGLQLGTDQQQAEQMWDEILNVMRDGKLRDFRIDIESDSTIQEIIEKDARALAQVMKEITGVINAFGPLVQSGVMPISGLKDALLGVARQAKLGRQFEDAIEQIETVQQAENVAQQPGNPGQQSAQGGQGQIPGQQPPQGRMG